MSFRDTIVAISSPPGIGAVGVIRLSGENAHEIGLKLSEKSSNSIKFRYAYHAFLKDHKGKDIDDAVIIFYKAPHSYTGEDMVEIFCHSGPAVLTALLDECIYLGARPAEAGEFTRRAFLNGKLDLVQVEAVADIIDAASPVALEAALNLRKGAFSKFVRDVRDRLLFLLSEFEAEIDFEEEELLEMTEYEEREELIRDIVQKLEEVCSHAEEGIKIKEGIKVALVGIPNVGKSSLMNALSKKERSIVTPEPGTTRDLVEEKVILKGLTVVLVDTAGIREATSIAEIEGVKRAKRTIEEADIVLYLLDSSREIEDREIAALLEVPAEKSLIVINKIDTADEQRREFYVSELRKRLEEEAPGFLEKAEIFMISALTGEGIDALTEKIVEKVFRGGVPVSESLLITNRRHLYHVKNALKILQEALDALKTRNVELTAFLLREASIELSRIIGLVSTEDILHEIFSRFCIGK